MKTVNMERLVADTEGLPILSKIADRVFEYLNSPGTTTTELTGVIENDPLLSSKILKVVNSPLFGFSREIYTINQAVVTIGFHAMKRIIMSLGIVNAKAPENFPLDIKRFAEDSFTAAVAAKLIVNCFEPKLEEMAFTAGFMMNIGQPLFALHYAEEYKSLLEKAKSSDKSLNEYEKKTFLWDHSRLGAMLARKWGFEDNIVLPIVYHHTPNPPLDEEGKEHILVPVIYLANLALEVFRCQAKKESLDLFKSEAQRRLHLSEATTHQILENISIKGNEIAGIFEFSLSLSLSYTQVLHAIAVQLGEMNLTYEQMVKELRKAKAEAEKLAHQLRIANEELKKRADIDGLTGIFNHRYFQEHLMVEYMRAVRYGSPLSVILFDIDFFKKVNDTYGHLTGDEVLRDFANILKVNTRISDFVARYGGEEFVAVLPETSIDNAYIVAEKIRSKVENHPFLHEGKSPIKVTVSGGITSVEGGKKYETMDEFVNIADKKMYRAKKGGRNQVIK